MERSHPADGEWYGACSDRQGPQSSGARVSGGRQTDRNWCSPATVCALLPSTTMWTAFMERTTLIRSKSVQRILCQDTSRKIRAVKKAQAQRGERIATRPRYGYQKAEDDPKKIVPDPEAAEVVRKIFQLCASGRKPSQITRKLKREQILPPMNSTSKSTAWP